LALYHERENKYIKNKMKTTITILIAMMALSLISAGCSDITAGESCTIQLDDLDSD